SKQVSLRLTLRCLRGGTRGARLELPPCDLCATGYKNLPLLLQLNWLAARTPLIGCRLSQYLFGAYVMSRSRLKQFALVLGVLISSPTIAAADEGGVSFWIPGFFGSLAAAPLQPGWTLQTNYYHTSVSAGAEVARAREITIGKIPV